MSCVCRAREKCSVTWSKAKLPQGLHNSKWMRPVGRLGQHQSHGLRNVHSARHWPQHCSPGTAEKQGVLYLEQGKRNWSGAGKGENPTPGRDSACTRLGLGSPERDSFGGRSKSVPGSVTGCLCLGTLGICQGSVVPDVLLPGPSQASSTAQPRVTSVPSPPSSSTHGRNLLVKIFATIPRFDPG